jgi:predicted metalloprotease with PDZ domain
MMGCNQGWRRFIAGSWDYQIVAVASHVQLSVCSLQRRRIDLQTSLVTHSGSATLLVALCILTAIAGSSQNSAGPQPVPLPPPIVAPADIPYPGTISLLVDMTNIIDRVLNVQETIPVKSHEVTLLFPQWLPGTHSPSNPIANMAGLKVTANGKRLDWTRDRVNAYAFHTKVPRDAATLEVNFQYLAPLKPKEGRISSNFADLTWNSVLLYPAGYFSRRIQFAPSVRLPEGWKFASALDVKSQQGNLVQFKETLLNTLIDSPLYAGVNFKRIDMSNGDDNKVFLDVFADQLNLLEITPEELQFHRNLVIEAQKLFNSHHYDHYDFLFSVSDIVSGKGLEHHQSSEDGARAKYFTDWAGGVSGRSLLAHEYTHSWNGKFRRPADLWTPNFNVPMQNDLLWVYEGLTEYYGEVLTARSGLNTTEQTRDLIALIAAGYDISPGRTWRTLEDTTNQAIMSYHLGVAASWPSWERSADYYMESLLIWLDADTKIRELSSDKKSLDDFARLFFGMDNGSFVTSTYTFDDVVTALNAVQKYDWQEFLRTRIYELAPQTPKNGLTQGGYRLAYNDEEPAWMKHQDKTRATSFATSLGLSVKDEGELQGVWWDSLAFKAGITPDMQLQAVNDQKFSIEKLQEAVLSAEKNKEPIKLLLKRGDDFVTVNLDYHDGLRYPHLQRVEGTPDRLDAILAPLK